MTDPKEVPFGERMALRARHKCPKRLIEFLDSGYGHAQHFCKVDPTLSPAVISKFRHGILPVSFEFAVRLERAQKASAAPFKADEVLSDPADKVLIAYVRDHL